MSNLGQARGLPIRHFSYLAVKSALSSLITLHPRYIRPISELWSVLRDSASSGLSIKNSRTAVRLNICHTGQPSHSVPSQLTVTKPINNCKHLHPSHRQHNHSGSSTHTVRQSKSKKACRPSQLPHSSSHCPQVSPHNYPEQHQILDIRLQISRRFS